MRFRHSRPSRLLPNMHNTARTGAMGLWSRLPLTIYKLTLDPRSNVHFKFSSISYEVCSTMLSPESLPSVLTVNKAVYWHCAVSKNSNIGPKNINRHEAVALSSH